MTLEAWKELSEVYLEAMRQTYAIAPLHPIHGDLNTSNVHHHKRDVDQLKLVDWEWAGIGGWWFDLVSLLKTAPTVLEQKGVAEFHRVAGIPHNQDAVRAYQWAKLQRGLFDASFFAKQLIDGTSAHVTGTRVNFESYIRSSLNRASNAMAKLKRSF